MITRVFRYTYTLPVASIPTSKYTTLLVKRWVGSFRPLKYKNIVYRKRSKRYRCRREIHKKLLYTYYKFKEINRMITSMSVHILHA